MKPGLTSYCGFICVVIIMFLTFVCCNNNVSATIITYPAPPGLITSPDFTVKVNDTPIWVERVSSKLPSIDYWVYSGREMEDLNVANFSCSGSLTIKITASAKIDSFIIRPKSRGIKAKVSGREMIFTIPGPQKLYVEINNLPHLAIFANPLEVNPPKQGDSGVVYYGPGTYDIGQIDLQSNQTIYIAGGAIVNADIRGSDLQNIKIIGRGMLQGNVRISGTSNLEVNGIFIRNTQYRTMCNSLNNCHHVIYRNVKIFSYDAIYIIDGINAHSCTNLTIDDCFMRCRDDCIAINARANLKADSIFVTNSVMVGWSYSDGFTIGFGTIGPISNVIVKNCDILYARGGGKSGGHSGFSIVCDGPSWIQNIRFEDIRVEEHVEYKNLELIVTYGKYYGNPDEDPGHIKGVYLKNVQWENAGKVFILEGFSPDNMVEDITFDHCQVGGKILTRSRDACFIQNAYVKNVKFIP